MEFTAFRELGPWAQAVIAAFVLLLCTLIFVILAFAISIPVFGLENIQNINALKLMQIFQSAGMFLVPPFIIGWLFTGNTFQYLSFKQKVIPSCIILTILLVIVANPVITFVGNINSNMTLPEQFSGIEQWMRQMEDQASELMTKFIQATTFGGILLNLVMIVLIPAVGEELLFRGVIQKIFFRITRNHHLAIWITAILFSALHLQFYGFFPRMILGALFGYLLVYSGSIWLPIAGHFINNLVAAFFLYMEKNKGLQVDTIDAQIMQWPIVIISLILTILIIWRIKNQYKNLLDDI